MGKKDADFNYLMYKYIYLNIFVDDDEIFLDFISLELIAGLLSDDFIEDPDLFKLEKGLFDGPKTLLFVLLRSVLPKLERSVILFLPNAPLIEF